MAARRLKKALFILNSLPLFASVDSSTAGGRQAGLLGGGGGESGDVGGEAVAV